jgi:DNA-binding beta-propeller fold protein YncE
MPFDAGESSRFDRTAGVFSFRRARGFRGTMFKLLSKLAAVIAIAGLATATRNCSGQNETSRKLVASGLMNPSGVAIQPVTGELFVSDTGRGRIIQVRPNDNREIVVDFPVDEFELDHSLVLGPLGLVFRGRNVLIVGSGGDEDGVDSITAFDLEQLGLEPFKPKDAVNIMKLTETAEHPAEGDFFNLAGNRNSLFVTCHGESNKGWIAKIDLVLNDMTGFRRFIPSAALTGVNTPGGMTVSPDGHLVLAQMGTREKERDSVLSFFDQQGQLLDTFPAGLNDVVAVAYGPRRKRLYALDFNWAEPKKGGLYKLVATDTADGCEAEFVMHFERPSAMAFDQLGNLYVTVCGYSEPSESIGDSNLALGKVYRIEGLD